MLGGEAELHIKGISIDWDKISRGSYLRDIPLRDFKLPMPGDIFTFSVF